MAARREKNPDQENWECYCYRLLLHDEVRV